MKTTNTKELKGWARHSTHGKWDCFRKGDYVVVVSTRGWMVIHVHPSLKGGAAEIGVYQSRSDALQRANKEMEKHDQSIDG